MNNKRKQRYLSLHMNDIVRSVNCRYCGWTRGNRESTTAWLICKLFNKSTDEEHCAICKSHTPKRKG